MAKNYSRRGFVKRAGVTACGLVLTQMNGEKLSARQKASEQFVYLGTYTSGKSEGIYLARFQPATGELKVIKPIQGVANPSFLAIDGRRRFVFAVNELMEFEGQKSGSVSSFAIDPATHDLRLINRQSSRGGAPCYVTVDRTNRYVLMANYMGGNAAVFPVNADGSLGTATSVVQHEGSSVNRDRQEAPHAHSIVLDPANKFAYVSDLGIDKVMIYGFDARRGTLTPATPPAAQLKLGSGPRHFAFHPSRPFAYVINELAGSVTVFARDAQTGALGEKQTVSTLPSDYSGENSCADIHLTPSGKFLYASNRGHDSIAAYQVDAKTGELKFVQHQPTGGKTPRNFAVDPSGRFLLVANQNSDTVVMFKIDRQTGELRSSGQTAQVPTPVCVRFL